MHVLLTVRHVEVTPEEKSYVEQKAAKLTKYYDLVQEIECVIEDASPVGYHVEVIVTAEHRSRFVANSRCDAVEHCIDDCCQKLERQLTEHKNRHRNRKHPEQGSAAARAAAV